MSAQIQTSKVSRTVPNINRRTAEFRDELLAKLYSIAVEKGDFAMKDPEAYAEELASEACEAMQPWFSALCEDLVWFFLTPVLESNEAA
jgi:hypothetical protein